MNLDSGKFIITKCEKMEIKSNEIGSIAQKSEAFHIISIAGFCKKCEELFAASVSMGNLKLRIGWTAIQCPKCKEEDIIQNQKF